MVRQIAVVLLGMPLIVLRAAAGGALLYHQPDIWTLGTIGRCLYDPLISLIVAAEVGVLTKNRAALLPCLSLTPVEVGTLTFIRRLNLPHMLLVTLLMILNLALGMVGTAFATECQARFAESSAK